MISSCVVFANNLLGIHYLVVNYLCQLRLGIHEHLQSRDLMMKSFSQNVEAIRNRCQTQNAAPNHSAFLPPCRENLLRTDSTQSRETGNASASTASAPRRPQAALNLFFSQPPSTSTWRTSVQLGAPLLGGTAPSLNSSRESSTIRRPSGEHRGGVNPALC
jgi:hypothetical protein